MAEEHRRTWPNALQRKLIELVKTKQMLWDSREDVYLMAEEKAQHWLHIADALKTTSG
jgi:hypothetical protein